MKLKIIQKERVKDLLKAAAREWTVYAPQKNAGGDVWIQPLPEDKEMREEALNNIVLENTDTVISAKEIFFPQMEPMFEIQEGMTKEITESAPKLLFGVRPCDLKAVLFADDFFKRNFEDIYYLSRAKDRFIVALGCISPVRPTCFCASAKTGPFAEGGFDLQLVESGDFYFVETGSAQGGSFIAKYKEFFGDAAVNAQEMISAVKSQGRDAIEVKVDFSRALDLMNKENLLPEENYKRIGERCIFCGGCLYVCPTCTCFNVFDNMNGKTGTRMRNWDACVFAGYTREASGHNPRKEKWQRTRRRYEHKLKYDYQTTGMSGCVGCGRCLSSCPVNIGISKFIQEITEDKKIM